MDQLDLLGIDQHLEREAESIRDEAYASATRDHIRDWEEYWGWDGPEVGGMVSSDSTFLRRQGEDGNIFAFTAPVRIIEKIDEDSWLGEIHYPAASVERNAVLECSQGVRVIMRNLDIGPSSAFRRGYTEGDYE
jgi:hypothetical protein